MTAIHHPDQAALQLPGEPGARKFVFAGTHTDDDLTEAERQRVADWLGLHPEAYEIRGEGKDVRLTLKWAPGTSHRSPCANDAGQFKLLPDGTLWLMGDNEFGWASTMSRRSVRETLARMLRTDQAPPAPPPASRPMKIEQADLFADQPDLFSHVRQPWELA